MKRMILGAVAVLIALGLLAGSASANTKYFLGKDTDTHLELSFIVKNDKVKKGLVEARQVKCTPDSHGGARQTIFFEFEEPIAVIDRAFKAETRARYDRGLLAGHVFGKSAKGRTSVKQEDRNRFCETDVLKWDAKKVSKKKWERSRY